MRPGERSEQEWMLRRKVLAGDEAAWRTLYDGSFQELWAYALWRCGGLRDLAEEVAQETWLVAVRRVCDFDPARGTFTAWVRGIASRVVQNHVRTRRRRREQSLRDAESLESSRDAEQHEQAELIAMSLAQLSQRHEDVLRAKYLDLASVEEIAGAQGTTPKAIESLLTRAREAFRIAYEKLAGEDAVIGEDGP